MSALGTVVLAGLLVPAVVVILAGLVVVVAASVSGGRAEADPSGDRTTAIYLATINWVALFIALFATFAIVVAVVGYIGSDGGNHVALPASGSFSQSISGSGSSGSGSSGTFTTQPGPTGLGVVTDTSNVTNQAVGAALVALAAGGVLALYLRRLWALVGDDERRRGPAGRPVRIYLLATCFAAVFIALFAGASALFGFYRLVAPGVAGMGSARSPGVRELIDSAYLALAALAIFATHHRLAFARPAPPAGELPM